MTDNVKSYQECTFVESINPNVDSKGHNTLHYYNFLLCTNFGSGLDHYNSNQGDVGSSASIRKELVNLLV